MINSDMRYTHAVAKIRALESRLIGISAFEKMWSSPDYRSAVGLLDDKVYRHKSFDRNIFEEELNGHLADVHILLKNIAVSHNMINVFLLKYDFFNLKNLLRSASGVPSSAAGPCGIFTLAELEDMAKTGIYSRFKIVSAMLPLALEKIGRDIPAEKTNTRLQQILFDVSIETAEKNKSEMLVAFLRKQIDLYNIDNFYRCRNQKKDINFLTGMLLTGGEVSEDVFIKAFRDAAELKIIQYEKFFGSYGDSFEKKSDDYLTEYMGRSKAISFGAEPLVGYLWAKEIEVKNLRIILYGKIYNMEKEKVFAELRKPYI